MLQGGLRFDSRMRAMATVAVTRTSTWTSRGSSRSTPRVRSKCGRSGHSSAVLALRPGSGDCLFVSSLQAPLGYLQRMAALTVWVAAVLLCLDQLFAGRWIIPEGETNSRTEQEDKTNALQFGTRAMSWYL